MVISKVSGNAYGEARVDKERCAGLREKDSDKQNKTSKQTKLYDKASATSYNVTLLK